MTNSPSRCAFLDEGEAIIRSGGLAHNFLWFYRDGMEASLSAADWDRADRYADALDRYTRPEPLPWADFFVARGRALAARGRGHCTAEIDEAMRSLRDEAARLGLHAPLVKLEAVLRSPG